MFQLHDEQLADGLRRIVNEQIDTAIAELRGRPNRTRDEGVHEARKRCKRLRALLRLVRDRLGEEIYQRENAAVRDASRQIAPVRDAQVLVKTLDDVVAKADGRLDAAAVRPTRKALKDAHTRLRLHTLYRGTAGEQTIAALTEVQQRSLEWPLGDLTFDDLAPGLRRVYGRGRKAMELSYADPRPEHFHEWRKRVKYLWHQLELVQPAWPGLLEALADETHDLSDLLGDEHDRTVLEAIVRERPDMVEDPDVVRTMAVVMDEQREQLRTAARPLGAKVYAESPAQFTTRIADYWASGRLET